MESTLLRLLDLVLGLFARRCRMLVDVRPVLSSGGYYETRVTVANRGVSDQNVLAVSALDCDERAFDPLLGRYAAGESRFVMLDSPPSSLLVTLASGKVIGPRA